MDHLQIIGKFLEFDDNKLIVAMDSDIQCEFDKLFYNSKSQASWSRNNGQASPAVRR